ncbi:hypothetical protein DBIPINDM_007529 (plasmid) [Mesorhizobium sp. AR02]|uniref:hypothetical protein n=1 Tax=Mesorhizobium sp. AR02 TaxID=2865837 RepID=UPI00215DF0F0|nr:hypothetical protein [Mesorhizobium sp. AR02]UVK50220.1 hypothetical protein DBIPINDM_007529 [Mesorhizobium sp. AR02]
MAGETLAPAEETHRRRAISTLFAAVRLAIFTMMVGTAGDAEDDYGTGLIDTAAKIMKSQVVKDPAAALEKAAGICKRPSQLTSDRESSRVAVGSTVEMPTLRDP